MEVNSLSDQIRRYLAVLWHWAWLLVLATMLAGGVAYLVSKQMTPIYSASATILINEAPSSRTTEYSALLMSERQTRTYAELMTRRSVMQAVLDSVGLTTLSPGQLSNAVSVEPVRDTTLIVLRVENPDPDLAATLANVLVEEFSKQVQDLQTSRYASSKISLETQLVDVNRQIEDTTARLAELQNSSDNQAERDQLQTSLVAYRQTLATLSQSYEQVRLAEAQSTSTVIPIEMATAPSAPIRPRVEFNALLAAAAGLILAMSAVLLVEIMDDTLRNPNEVFPPLGVSILGMISRFETENGEVITALQPRSPVSEAFRSVRTNIQYASVDKPLRVLLVTSPSPSEGKSTVASNVATVLAQSGKKVIIIDADLRRPRVHKVLQLPNRRGMSDLFVQEQISLDGIIQTTENSSLRVISSGGTPPNPSELLGSEKMVEILEALKKEADVVIIDSPPVLAVTDASVLAQRADGVILVVRPGSTKQAACRQAVEQLRRTNANLLGVVLNGVELNRSRYYYYYHYKGYYYTYYSQYAEKDSGKKGKQAEPSKEATIQ